MRRGSIIQLTAIALVAGAISTAVALLIPWLPPAAGEEATRIHLVYWFATVIALVVFSIVAAVLVFEIWKFRAKPDDDSDGPPIHGHTKLEIVWTAIPAALVTSIAVISAVVLAQNGRAGSNPLNVKVVARQFAWTFTYSNGKTYGYLMVPKGRHVRLDLTSNDVIHSFWVPELSQKQDALAGQHTHIIITPTRTGTFPVICTELCGVGHSLMRSHVTIVEPAKFAAWFRSGSKKAAGPPGLAVFQQNGCASCHTFKPASATGKIGPDLDNLQQYAAQAKRGPLEAFIKESIVTPGAYIQPGFSDLMPHTFGQQIPSDKLDQLVQYLAAGSKKA
ncbi:MAG: cytochrome c oxidase subunit II [Gaiellaceae bacterium]